MILGQENFVIRMLLLDTNNSLTSIDLTDSINGFTSNNSAPVLGEENMKYKIMFNDLEIPSNTKFITFQVSLKVDDRYYNPYLFLPISNQNKSDYQDGPGRVLSYRLFDNKINFIWMYFTRDSVEKIINEFQALDEIIESNEYIKEYMQLCVME